MLVNEIAPRFFKGLVYHGTGSVFDEFKQSEARLPNDYWGGGVAYFTDDKAIGESYARNIAKKYKSSPLLYWVKLSLNNIFDVDATFTGQELIDILPDNLDDFARGASLMKLGGPEPYIIKVDLKNGKMTLTGAQIFHGLSRGMVNTAKTRKYLIKNGYDGLRYNGGIVSSGRHHNVYLAYYAKSINIVKRTDVET